MRKRFLTQATVILALLTATTATKLHAQVTIGNSEPPRPGAILDLKNQSDGSATMGLGLPRVALMNLNPTSADELAKSIGNQTGSYSMNDHIGMVVYNAKEIGINNLTCKMEGAPIGMYVWSGTEWGLLGKPEEQDKRTTTDDGSQVTISYKDETTSYRYSKFGDAGYWMTENLATQYLPDGTLLPKLASDIFSDTNPGYKIPGGMTSVQGKEGLLYNWSATMNRYTCTGNIDQGQVASITPGANEVETLNSHMQGICPKGWHIPSDREWNDLEREIATKADQYTQTPLTGLTWESDWETGKAGTSSPAVGWRGTATNNAHGKAMKSKDTTINGYSSRGDSKTAQNGGFDVLLIGTSGTSADHGQYTVLWSSSLSNGNKYAWGRYLVDNNARVYRDHYTFGITGSIRCKKD